MKEILKENFALIAVILLPIVLGTIFYISVSIQKSQFEPPNYKLVFTDLATQNSSLPYQLIVKDQKLYASYTPREKNQYYRIPNLYIYDAQTDSSERVNLPKVEDKTKGFEVIVDQLKNEVIIDKQTSPDGYIIERTHYNRGLMNELFSAGSRNRNNHILTKDGNYTSIPNSNHYNINVIGWISNEPE